MLSITRETKRLIVIAIFLLAVILLGVGIYFLRKPAPTCFDGAKNQDEQGIDCGGVCANACIEKVVGQPLEVKEVAVIQSGTNTYDVLGTVSNPNGTVGASSFDYLFVVKDSNGKEVGEQAGSSWILPGETKTLLAFNISSSDPSLTASLTLSNLAWERLTNYQGRPQVNLYEKRYTQISSGVGFGEARVTLRNESPYDFRTITVKVILRGETGKPLAVQQTVQTRVNANQERDIPFLFPNAFSGSVARVDMEADADVYHSENFVNQYFPGGSFQRARPDR